MFVLFGRASILNQPFPALGTKPFVPLWELGSNPFDTFSFEGVEVFCAFLDI